MSRTAKKLLLTGKMLFSGTLMFLLYRKIPVGELTALLASLDLRFLPLIIVLLFFNTAASAWKWRLFLLADGVNIPLSTLTVTYMIGSFY
ncbi:flippase-like domain-containing protein, partial [Desulfobulbus sp. F4]|nr:flippase-like domain-containing protein [Desulfobulbus sp. F4]